MRFKRMKRIVYLLSLREHVITKISNSTYPDSINIILFEKLYRDPSFESFVVFFRIKSLFLIDENFFSSLSTFSSDLYFLNWFNMNPETEKKINYSFLCLLKFVLMKKWV